MRISELKGNAADLPAAQAQQARQAQESRGLEFRRDLRGASETARRQWMDGLAQRIAQQGHVVAERLDLAELHKYRELVGELLNTAAGGCFAFEKSEAFDNWGRPRSFAAVRSIDKKLEEMTAEILKDQADTLRILELVDDIRGLIVDMFL